MNLKIAHPTSARHFELRNALLQSSMRPKDPIFSIQSEYPILLTPQMSHTSYCVFDGDVIAAHLTLHVRSVTSSTAKLRLGFIGNVATMEKYRGQGLMRKLFDHVNETAKKLEIQGLLLWSDLDKFYQTLGFVSCGEEIRYKFSANSELPSNTRIALIDHKTLSNSDLIQLLSLRQPTTWDVERSLDEFKTLLSIPLTHLFCLFEGSTIKAYGICGKGYDLGGVLHEWGGANSLDVVHCFRASLAQLSLNDGLLLCPKSVSEDTKGIFQKHALASTSHPMGLIHILDHKLHATMFNDFFCWGLDSI
jgi:GNAT superfamily N-acetyltransferase